MSISSDYSQVFISSNDYNSVSLYRKRRQAMLKELDSFCVIAGMSIEPGGEEAFVQTWNKMVQEPAFVYLTGINQPGCYLLLDPRDSSEVLFVPEKNPFKEFWNGKRLGYVEGNSDVSKVTGIKDVRPLDELWDTIAERARKKPNPGYAYAFYFEKWPDDHNDLFRKEMKKALAAEGLKGFKIKSCAGLHWKLRLPLEKERIMDACKAQNITDEAFRGVLGQMSSLKNERQLGLLLDYEMQKRSDGDLAFPTIVAGGENACCLHYVKKDEPLQQGNLVLLDFGIRYNSLHSDLSRTIPVNGKFNLLQKMLYEIVLDAQTEYQKSVRPGVSLKEIGNIPWDFIMTALEDRLVKGAKGKFKLLYDKRPHGVSHFIGEQIHEGEPGTRSLDVTLVPGMLISCEPGLYGEFWATIGGKKFHEKIGIRIEDDLLITKDGFQNISENIPKSVKDLESLIQ
ncbi:MAG: Xaa-Pro aminopeptidase [Fibrobacter sp.]|nr:Xaa-Pro aminopeptidase [Fibrobacter sp.]